MSDFFETKYTMTPEQLYHSRNKVVSNAKDRLQKRADKIVEIINNTAEHNRLINWRSFQIDGLNNMIENTLDIVYKWDGGKYDKAIKSNKESFEKSRNYWCREKAKPIGNKLIHPILSQLLQYIDSMKQSINTKDRALLYIDIIINVLSTKIKFPRTSPKPLVLHSAIFKMGLLKDHCKMIIQCFNFDDTLDSMMKWGSDSNSKQKTTKDKRCDPANSVYNTFMLHLSQIKSQILECDDMTQIQNGMTRFMDWIYERTDIIYDNVVYENDVFDNDVYDNGFVSPRPFQIADSFIDPSNRVHHNLESLRNRKYERNVSVERHIEQMRMQRNQGNMSEYEYMPPCCCISKCDCRYYYNNYPY